MKPLRVVSLVAYSALLAAPVAAQEPERAANEQGSVYIPAEPIKRSAPTYPINALDQRREGWVVVSFVISEGGKVIEPMIEESSNSVFEASALRAIESWSYKPATVGGKPVEQSMVQTIIRYKMEDARGATPQFIRKFRAIQSSIAAKSFDEADRSLQALETGELNYYESAWLWWLKYVYLEAMGGAEPQTLMRALGKALGGTESEDDDYLDPDIHVSASQRLYVLLVRGGDFSKAISVLERLKASKSAQRSKLYKDAVAALEPTYRQILTVVAGPQTLRQKAQVEEHNYWFHRMLRRSFSFGDVQGGRLDVVDLRCTRANRRLVSVPEDAILKIPDSWGDCRVYIKGDPGTTFSFEEYADNVANTVDPAQMKSKAE